MTSGFSLPDGMKSSAPTEPMCDEPITSDSLLPLLRTVALGRSVLAYNRCDSTFSVARRLLEARLAGAAPPANGTLIVTEHQSAGRGRDGRAWVSPPGQSLLLGLILYPSVRQCEASAARLTGGDATDLPALANLVTIAASVAMARVLRAAGVESCAIKWPNDIVSVSGAKLCGILTENVALPGTPDTLVAGIGVNVNQTAVNFPPELHDIATSVRVETGQVVNRMQLLADFLLAMEHCLALENRVLIETWRSLSDTLGADVSAKMGGQTIYGRAEEIRPDGRLVLRLESGEMLAVSSGDVEKVRRRENKEHKEEHHE